MKLKTSSTSPENAWLEPHPKLDGLALIDHLFNRLDGLYPHKWRSAFASDQAIANWRTAWAEGLSDEGVTAEELRAGLRACHRRDWPPSFAEFFKDCRPPIDYQSALIEAVDQMARRESLRDRWSHPAIYWAAVKIGAYDLGRKTLKELLPEWRKALGDQLELGEWPDVSARLPALPAPGQTHNRAVGGETIPAMLERLNGAVNEHMAELGNGSPISAGLDPLLWARKPRSQHAFYLLKAGSGGGNATLSGILGDLVEAGVCTGDGKLLYCWQGGQWVSVDPPRPAA